MDEDEQDRIVKFPKKSDKKPSSRQGKGPAYSALSTIEKFEWHADVYAFRRVLLGIEESEQTSPCDPQGEWYDPAMVGATTQRYWQQYKAAGWDRERLVREQQRREGRDILNRYAQARGFPDWDTYYELGGTYTEVIRSFGGIKRIPQEKEDEQWQA